MVANRWDQLLDAWSENLRKAFLEAIYALRDNARLDEIERLLRAGDVEGAIRAVGLDPATLRPFDKQFQAAYEAGAVYTANLAPASLQFVFNIRNLAAESWLRSYSSTLITEILDDQRTAVRNFLTARLSQGANPRTTALDLVGRINKTTGRREGGVIGLTSTQEQWVRNYEAELSSDNPLSALNKNLRDARFDASVRKAAASGKPISADLKAKMVAAYKNRALRYRAETIARSETMTALHQAQHDSVYQMIQSGKISRDQVQSAWRSSHDNRVRDAHRDLDGKKVAFGGTFNSILGPIRFPGDPHASAENTINCRCWLEMVIDFLKGIK